MENIETAIKHALEFYLSLTKLEEVQRQGWLDWNVPVKRIESVPDHIFATTQLAYAIWSEFDIDVNIEHVIMLLVFHETEETVIGDISLESDLRNYKDVIGDIAVNSLTSSLNRSNLIKNYIKEFNERITPEAKFARFVDKLECDIKSKLYDEESPVNILEQQNNPSAKNELVKELLASGKSFSQMWMSFGRSTYKYPKEFEEISKYAEKNNLHEIRESKLNEGKSKVDEYLKNIK